MNHLLSGLSLVYFTLMLGENLAQLHQVHVDLRHGCLLPPMGPGPAVITIACEPSLDKITYGLAFLIGLNYN